MDTSRQKIIVQGHNSTQKEPLNYYPNGSFQLQWEKNQTWQLTFTMIDDGTVAYQLLGVEASIFWDDQEYVIKQCTTDYSNGIGSKEITATHVYSEVQRILQRTVKTGTLTYTVDQVLSFVLKNNVLGFTWKVIGNFGKEQITDLGNINGKDMLSKITDTWPDAIIYPDNKKIRVYSHDSFVKDRGNRIDYRANASSIKNSYDSTAISNQVMAVGAEKEGSDSDKPEYYFKPFLVTDSNSVKKWGLHPRADVSDERFHDKKAMQAFAKSQLVLEPALSIEVTEDTFEKPIPGDLRRVEIREASFVTKTEVVGFTYYPLDQGQLTQVTLNNTAQTIINYQNSLQRQMRNAINDKSGRLNRNIKSIRDAISKLQNGNPNPGGNWIPGTMFMDVSDWQKAFTQEMFTNFYQAGIKGVIIKLTQGSEDGEAYINPSYADHRKYALNAKMKLIGTYHYLKAQSVADAVKEGEWYVKKLKEFNVPRDAIVACDLEDDGLPVSKETLTAELEAFYKVLISAGYTNTTDYSTEAWFDQRFDSQGKYKWIASWGVEDVPEGADAWQYTNEFNDISLDVNRSYNKAFI